MKHKIKAGWVVIATIALGYFLVYGGKDFVLGLDLAGGSALTYKIDISSLPKDADVTESVASLRDVVERRVNLFGVREPTVTTQYSRLASEWRLVVELPGVTDVIAAQKMIGETPVLDFRTPKPGVSASSTEVDFINSYNYTALTGRYLDRAGLVFDQTTNRPKVELIFDEDRFQFLPYPSIKNASTYYGANNLILFDNEVGFKAFEKIYQQKASIQSKFEIFVGLQTSKDEK